MIGTNAGHLISSEVLSAKPEAAAEEVEHVAGTAVGEGIANVVRRAFIDPHLDIPDVPSERLVICGRADRLGAGNDH